MASLEKMKFKKQTNKQKTTWKKKTGDIFRRAVSIDYSNYHEISQLETVLEQHKSGILY